MPLEFRQGLCTSASLAMLRSRPVQGRHPFQLETDCELLTSLFVGASRSGLEEQRFDMKRVHASSHKPSQPRFSCSCSFRNYNEAEVAECYQLSKSKIHAGRLWIPDLGCTVVYCLHHRCRPCFTAVLALGNSPVPPIRVSSLQTEISSMLGRNVRTRYM